MHVTPARCLERRWRLAGGFMDLWQEFRGSHRSAGASQNWFLKLITLYLPSRAMMVPNHR